MWLHSRFEGYNNNSNNNNHSIFLATYWNLSLKTGDFRSFFFFFFWLCVWGGGGWGRGESGKFGPFFLRLKFRQFKTKTLNCYPIQVCTFIIHVVSSPNIFHPRLIRSFAASKTGKRRNPRSVLQMYFFAWAAPEQEGRDSSSGRKKNKSEKCAPNVLKCSKAASEQEGRDSSSGRKKTKSEKCAPNVLFRLGSFGTNYTIFAAAEFFRKKCLINAENSIRQPDLNPRPVHQSYRNCEHSKQNETKVCIIFLYIIGFILYISKFSKSKTQVPNQKLKIILIIRQVGHSVAIIQTIRPSIFWDPTKKGNCPIAQFSIHYWFDLRLWLSFSGTVQVLSN